MTRSTVRLAALAALTALNAHALPAECSSQLALPSRAAANPAPGTQRPRASSLRSSGGARPGTPRTASAGAPWIGRQRVVVMNPPGTSYVDPELHPTEPEMVFQTPGGVWLGAIDRGTGLFVSADGLDRFVDVTTSLTVSKNGPEYGLDVGGTAVFYNRIGTSGQVEIWRATPGAAGFTTESLTAPDLDRINQLPSQDAAAPSTHLLYARIGGGAGIGSIARLDEDDPAGEALITPLLPGFAGFRWARGSTLYTSTIAAGPEAGEVVLGDARTGVERTVTGGQGLQFDPFAWFAPEFGGATCVISVTAGTDLAVWRDTGGATFDLHAMLPPPPGTSMRFVQSAEPFVADGRSFVSLTLKDHPGSIYTDVTESEIWIYGIDGGAERYVQRADDLGPGRIRHEAETFAGDGEVFLYYNELLPSGRFDLVRVRTGLRP